MVNPGLEVMKLHGGIRGFMKWDKALLTDSGGFQVFSLAENRVIKEEGVYFTNPKNGDKLFYHQKSDSDSRSFRGGYYYVF